MGRRGAGEGSVYWIADRECWAGAVEIRTYDGKRHRKVVKAKTKAEVLTKMRDIQTKQDHGLSVGSGTTTGAWLEFWLEQVIPGTGRSERTPLAYRDALRIYVIPYIGTVPIAQLGPEHVQRWMRTLERKGFAPSTISWARSSLRRALSDAVMWGKTSRNAAALVRAPGKTATHIDDALDADQAAAVLRTAHGDRFEAMAVLVLTLGLRQGEVLRLRWQDIDLDAGTLTIKQAKTDAGARTIAVPAFAVSALKTHRARQREERMAAPDWDDPELVFATELGTPIGTRTALRWWHALTIQAGVGRHRFHASRHTAATLMLNNGVPLEVVSKTLGHAGLAITADVYARVRPELQRTAADAMQDVLGRSV